MTNAEWESFLDKVERHINTLFGGASPSTREIYLDIFSRGVTIIVEVEPEEFKNWMTTGDGKTIHMALNAPSISAAIANLRYNGSTIASALPQGHDNGWQRYTRVQQLRDNRIASAGDTGLM